MKKEHLDAFDEMIYNKLKGRPTRNSFVDDLVKLAKDTDIKKLKKKFKNVDIKSLRECLKDFYAVVPIKFKTTKKKIPEAIRLNTKYLFVGSKRKIPEKKKRQIKESTIFPVKFVEGGV